MGNKKYIFAIALFLIVGTAIFTFASSPDRVTVSFYTAGGTDVDSIKIDSGGTISSPKTTREGYKFAGWFLYDELFDFSTKITEDITLSAKWEGKGSELDTEEKEDTKTGSEKEEENTKEEEKEKEDEVDEPDEPTEAATRYTVTFVFGNGTANKSFTVTAGRKLKTGEAPANPTRSGYVFTGWKANNGLKTSSAITSNATFTAQWQKDSYVIQVSTIDNFSPQRKFKVLKNGSDITASITMPDSFGAAVAAGGYLYADASQLTAGSYTIIYGGKTYTATVKK